MTESKGPELKTLDQLATENNQLTPRRIDASGKSVPVDPDGHLYLWEHRVADSIHGWSSHEYHYGEAPITLTDELYAAALQAARDGHTPHGPAVPKSPAPEQYEARIKANADALAKKKKELEDERKAVKSGAIVPPPAPVAPGSLLDKPSAVAKGSDK